jgi:hypothetical protein
VISPDGHGRDKSRILVVRERRDQVSWLLCGKLTCVRGIGASAARMVARSSVAGVTEVLGSRCGSAWRRARM